MKWGLAGIIVTGTFRGQEQVEGGGRVIGIAKAVNDPMDIVDSGNRLAIDFDKVGTNGAGAERAEVAVADSVAVYASDVRAMKGGALSNIDVSRVFGMCVERHRDSAEFRERVDVDSEIELESGILEVHDVKGLARLGGIQKTGIRGAETKGGVRHGFIEGNVSAMLDGLRVDVVVEDVFERLSIAKEDAASCVGMEFLGATFVRTIWKGVEQTTKCSEQPEIRFVAGTEFEWGLIAVAVRGDIVEAEVMVKGIWPKLGGKAGTTQHGVDPINDRLMWTFARAVLAGGVGSGGFNAVTGMEK